MKKIICLLLCITILSVSFLSVLAEDEILVLLNGEKVNFDVKPIIVNDRTLVPMRAIFEAFGAVVLWNDRSQTITARKDDTLIFMQIDNVTFYVNDTAVTLDVPPQIYDSRTLVPVRAIAEGLDAEVKWDESSSTVTIETKDYTAKTPAPTGLPSPTPTANSGGSGGGKTTPKPTATPKPTIPPQEQLFIPYQGFDNVPDFGAYYDLQAEIIFFEGADAYQYKPTISVKELIEDYVFILEGMGYSSIDAFETEDGAFVNIYTIDNKTFVVVAEKGQYIIIQPLKG